MPGSESSPAAGDDQVGAAVDGVVEVGEGAVDRRRQQEDAEDHPDAEDDPAAVSSARPAGATWRSASEAKERTSVPLRTRAR